MLALSTALTGCGGNGEATEAETNAIRDLEKTARLYDDKERRVVRIDFGGRPIGEEQLANAGNCARLESLLMQGSKIEEAGFVHLAGLERLQKISLKKSSVTDAGLAHLGELKTLREIDLEETKITDGGLEHLAGLKNLEKLYLTGTSTTSVGVTKLKQALPHLNVR